DIRREAREEVIAETFLADSPSVAVTVHDGIVTLSGRTDTGQLARALVMAVRQIEGVVAVRDQLGHPGRAQRPTGVIGRSPPARLPGSKAKAPCTSGSMTAGWRRSGSTSTNRRASSRRSYAVAPTPSPPTSPRACAASAPWPTRRVPARQSK